uniref:LRAT domain-containing protein n=1 Tax=Catharus ustulatus TaxID=91951 RepID=A0A8C3VA97_CATUS
MRDVRDDPKPGDLIEIKRGQYAHWALYVGDGYVIHVTIAGKAGVPWQDTEGAKVIKERLEEAAGNDNWCVNNKYDHCRTPFPVEEIIRRAESEIGKVMPYHLFNKNCEHFVTKLRYGEGVSEQVSATIPLVAGLGVGTLASIGITSHNIVDHFTHAKFLKANKDILEERCC